MRCAACATGKFKKRKETIMKKIISIVLALVLVVALAAMPASAAEGKIVDYITENNRFYAAISHVEEAGIYNIADVEGDVNEWLNGFATRGEYALWLARYAGVDLAAVEGTTELSDLAAIEGTDMYKAIVWGETNGYIKGYKDGTFKADRVISREEICALIARFERANDWAGLEETGNITYFIDQDDFSAYTIEEQNVVECVTYGLIHGRASGRFDAKHVNEGEDVFTTRQQLAAIFYRAAGNPVYTTKAFCEAVVDGDIYSGRINEHGTIVLHIADGSYKSIGDVTVTAEVFPIAKAGIESYHKVTKTVSVDRDLPSALPLPIEAKNYVGNLFTFGGCTINVDFDGVAVTYYIWEVMETENGIEIVMIAEDAQALRAAYEQAKTAVTYEIREGGDNYAILKAGAYAQASYRKATVTGDIVADDVKNSYKDIIADAIDKVEIDNNCAEEAYEVFVAAGTQVAFGSRVATVENDVKVAVEGVDAFDLVELIVDLPNAEDYANAALSLIEAVDDLIGELSGSEINVTVEIG